VDKILCCQNL